MSVVNNLEKNRDQKNINSPKKNTVNTLKDNDSVRDFIKNRIVAQSL